MKTIYLTGTYLYQLRFICNVNSIMSHMIGLSEISLPTNNYSNSNFEEFPSSKRVYKVESGFSIKYLRDSLPLKANLSNGTVADIYVDFVVNSNQVEFLI